MKDLVNNKDKDQQQIEFDKFDTNEKKKLSKLIFLHTCEVHLGEQNQVALKFLKNRNISREKLTLEMIL